MREILRKILLSAMLVLLSAGCVSMAHWRYTRSYVDWTQYQCTYDRYFNFDDTSFSPEGMVWYSYPGSWLDATNVDREAYERLFREANKGLKVHLDTYKDQSGNTVTSTRYVSNRQSYKVPTPCR